MSTESAAPAPASRGGCPLCGEACGIRCSFCKVYRLCAYCLRELCPPGCPRPTDWKSAFCGPCQALRPACVLCTVPSALSASSEAECNACGFQTRCSECSAMREVEVEAEHRRLCGACLDECGRRRHAEEYGTREPSCPGCGHPSPDGECACIRCRDCGMVLILGDGAYGRCGDCASELLRPRPQR